jgi:hypothetical protein
MLACFQGRDIKGDGYMRNASLPGYAAVPRRVISINKTSILLNLASLK